MQTVFSIKISLLLFYRTVAKARKRTAPSEGCFGDCSLEHCSKNGKLHVAVPEQTNTCGLWNTLPQAAFRAPAGAGVTAALEVPCGAFLHLWGEFTFVTGCPPLIHSINIHWISPEGFLCSILWRCQNPQRFGYRLGAFWSLFFSFQNRCVTSASKWWGAGENLSMSSPSSPFFPRLSPHPLFLSSLSSLLVHKK